MAVLVQEIINADYAFVIHTTNPSSGDSSEIYAEVLLCLTSCIFSSSMRVELASSDPHVGSREQVVKGLGETLVGAYPGRALSFVCKKSDIDSPQVNGLNPQLVDAT